MSADYLYIIGEKIVKMNFNYIKSSRFFKNSKECILRYFELHIGGSAAELSYYFLFSVFPLIMATGAVTIMSGGKQSVILSLLESLLPELVSELFADFYDYVAMQNNRAYLSMGLFLALCAVTRYINCIKSKIREIYDTECDRNAVYEWLLSFVFSFFIVIGFYFTFLLQVAGERLLKFLSEHILFIPQEIINGWLSLRFAAIGIYVFILLLLTYRTIPSRGLTFKSVVGGAVFSTASWILVSVIFSFYIDNFANYSALYGSIGAFIVLMLWLFIINNIILAGAVVNKVFGDNSGKEKGKRFF